MTSEEFRALGHRMVDWIAAYWDRVESLPVLSRVTPGEVKGGLPESPPESGLGSLGAEPSDESGEGDWPQLAAAPADQAWSAVFEDLERTILPGVTHWQSPSFFGYFPANASGPAVLGELLSAGLGVQGMLWATSPACTELEERVLDWLVEAMGLPREWRSDSGKGAGVIQGTASEAALVALVAARQRARRQGWDGRMR